MHWQYRIWLLSQFWTILHVLGARNYSLHSKIGGNIRTNAYLLRELPTGIFAISHEYILFSVFFQVLSPTNTLHLEVVILRKPRCSVCSSCVMQYIFKDHYVYHHMVGVFYSQNAFIVVCLHSTHSRCIHANHIMRALAIQSKYEEHSLHHGFLSSV